MGFQGRRHMSAAHMRDIYTEYYNHTLNQNRNQSEIRIRNHKLEISEFGRSFVGNYANLFHNHIKNSADP